MHLNFADLDAHPKFAQKVDASADAAAVVTVVADPEQFWVLDWISFSYSGAPTGGNLKVQIGSTVLLDVDIAAAGQDLIEFGAHPLYKSAENLNESMVITLAAGGSGVTGKLNIRYR